MTGAARRTSRQTPLQAAARLTVLLVALLGLFAMHGLADHGSAGHGAMPGMPDTPGASVMPGDTGHHGPTGGTPYPGAHDTTTVAAETYAGVGDTSGGGHHDGSLVELCLAVLGALLLLLAAGTVLVRLRRPAHALVAAQRQAVAWVRARDPAPPDLTRLCILRC